MPKSDQTQRARALRAYWESDIPELRIILDEAQNSPPLGQADGSISSDEWDAFRRMVSAQNALESANAAFETAWRLGE